MKLTRQGVRDLDAIPDRSRGRRPSADAEALANGRLPRCRHQPIECEQYDDDGMFLVGYAKRCAVCGVWL